MLTKETEALYAALSYLTGDEKQIVIAEIDRLQKIVGYDRAKPTDIWTNSEDWIPRPQCKNGNPNCHHQRAPRGSKTGTQGRKGSYERSIIPHELCLEVLSSACG